MKTADEEQRLAVAMVNDFVAVLRQRLGYDFVALSIAKLVHDADGDISCPGATLFDANPLALPAFPNLASNLRTLADQVDQAFRQSGAAEASESYSHVIESPSRKRGGA